VSRRIFLAIPAPPEIHNYLTILKEQNKDISEIKWMKDHNLHLTIYFVGGIEDDDFDKIVKILDPIIQQTKTFSFQFEKIILAPSVKPKMIWAKFQMNEVFTQLSEAINKALAPIVSPTKFHYKEPIPHITLARFHPFKQVEQITFPSISAEINIPVSSIQIFESVSTPTGVRYDNLGSFFYLSK